MSSISSLTSSWSSALFTRLDTKNKGYLEESDLASALASSSSTGDSTSAEDVFATLDSNSDGKVTQSELTTALQNLADSLDSQFGAQRMNSAMQGMGGQPPAPPADDEGFTKDELQSQLEEIGSSDSARSSLISSVVENFDEADTDGDGKVSFQEAMSYQQSTSSSTGSTSSSTDTSSALSDLAEIASMLAAGSPPPPPQNDTGFTKDELQSQLDEIGSSDSARSSLLSSVIENFDAADTDGDGKVSFQEAMAYQQSNSSDSTSTVTATTASSSGSSTSSSTEEKELAVMLRIMQLAQSYGGWTGDMNFSSSSLSVSV